MKLLIPLVLMMVPLVLVSDEKHSIKDGTYACGAERTAINTAIKKLNINEKKFRNSELKTAIKYTLTYKKGIISVTKFGMKVNYFGEKDCQKNALFINCKNSKGSFNLRYSSMGFRFISSVKSTDEEALFNNNFAIDKCKKLN